MITCKDCKHWVFFNKVDSEFMGVCKKVHNKNMIMVDIPPWMRLITNGNNSCNQGETK